MFSDTAPYFHLNDLQNWPKHYEEKNFFSMELSSRTKKLFSKIDCELLLDANLTKLIGSLYLT